MTGPARSCPTPWSRSGRPTGRAATTIPPTTGRTCPSVKISRASDARAQFSFWTVKPGHVPGPDGQLQAPHVTVSVFARGLLKRLVTRIYFPDEEEANAVDTVLSSIEDQGLRRTLIACDEGDALRFDIHLQGDGQTAFFAF